MNDPFPADVPAVPTRAIIGADDRFGLGVRLHLLTRSPRAVAGRLPWLAADPRVRLVENPTGRTLSEAAVACLAAGAASVVAVDTARKAIVQTYDELPPGSS